MKHNTLKYLWHYVPLIVIAFFIGVNFLDPGVGLWITIFFRWILLPSFVLLFFALLHSWRIGGTHKHIIFSLFSLEVIALIVFFSIRVPAYKCDPDKMQAYYEDKKSELKELIAYTQSALEEGQNVFLEFEHGKVSIFHTPSSSNWNVSDSLKTLLMDEVGLDTDEFDTIRAKLKSVNCSSVNTHFPDYCDIGYKRVNLGLYSFRVYLSPMNEEQIQEALMDGHFIPYDSTTLFMYGGGAAGPDVFHSGVKQVYLQKHPFPEPASLY